MPSEFVPEIDSEFPSGPFNVLAHLHDNSYASPYPVFHKLLALPLYAAILLLCKLSGQLSSFTSIWPYGLHNPAMVMTAFIMTVRLIAVFMGATVIALIARIIRPFSEGLTTRNTLFLYLPVVAIGLSQVTAYYARSTNYDMPQLFWWTLSLFFLWRFLFEHSGLRRHLVISAIAGAGATATKDQTGFFILCFAMVILICGPSSQPLRKKIFNATIFACWALGSYLLMAVAIQPLHWLAHIRQALFLTMESNLFTIVPPTLHGQIVLIQESVRCLAHIISPVGVVLVIASVVLLIKQRAYSILIIAGLPVLFTYVTTIARIRFVYERWLLNDAVLMTLLISAALGGIIKSELFKKPTVRIAIVTTLLIWCSYQLTFSFIPLTCAQINHPKAQLSKLLDRLVPTGDTLQFSGRIISLPDARAYTHFRFALSNAVYDSIHSTRMNHVLVRSNQNRRFVLADHDRLKIEAPHNSAAWWNMPDNIDTMGLRLIAEVGNQAFIEENIHVYEAAQRAQTFRISPRYYLYERTGNHN